MTATALALLISSLAPSFPEPTEAAQMTYELAAEHRLDAELIVRYVHSESRWQPGVEHVNSTDVYTGLGQIRLRNYTECRDGFTGAACQERRAALLEWRTNLAETVRFFVFARGYCKEVAHVSGERYWLQVVTGWDAKRRTHCGHRRNGRALPIPDPVRALLRFDTRRIRSRKHTRLTDNARSRMVAR